MDFFEVISKRRSIRSFKKDEIPEDSLKKILQAAIAAPSAGNLQSYEIIVVSKDNIKKELAKAALDQDFIAEAPINIIFCTNPKRCSWKYGKRGEELYSLQDATIAAAYLQLAATSLGLGSVWVGAFKENEVSKILDLPSNLRPIIIIPIGYPNEEPSPTSRRPLRDIVRIK